MAFNESLEQHLPKIYVAFRGAHPVVAEALDELGRATEQAGPLDARTQRLVKVALAVGSLSEGAVRSNAVQGAGGGRHGCRDQARRSARHHVLWLSDGDRRARLDRRGPRAYRGALMSHHPELSPSEGGAVLAVHVQPGAGRTEGVGRYGDAVEAAGGRAAHRQPGQRCGGRAGGERVRPEPGRRQRALGRLQPSEAHAAQWCRCRSRGASGRSAARQCASMTPWPVSARMEVSAELGGRHGRTPTQ